jgi:hypothetical protein
LPGFTLLVFAMAGIVPMGMSAWTSTWGNKA